MILALEVILFGFLLVAALEIVRTRHLFGAAMMSGLFSLVSAGLFLLMDAVDVAFTEAAVGAGISTVLILGALSRMDESEHQSRQRILPLLVVIGTGAALAYATIDLPAFQDPAAPIHHHVAPRYLEQSWDEIAVPNVVTSVLASYRGYDTFGELTVIFTAGLAVLILLGAAGQKAREDQGRSPLATARRKKPMKMREKPVLRIMVKRFFPFVLLFALYVQFHGDFGPGGGFQAGVIFAVGFVLFALIFGLERLNDRLPPRVVQIGMALGLLLYGGTGVAAAWKGGTFLDYDRLAHDAVHGQHLGIFLVELGVGLTVASVMISLFVSVAGRKVPS